MNVPGIAVGSMTATALLTIGLTVGGFGSAAAQPGDYGALPIHPNEVTDSTAYKEGPPVLNPDGQPGVTAVYTHRDGTREITNTILVLPDAAAATAAMNASQAKVAGQIGSVKTQPAAVGTGGTTITGTSANGSRSVSVLLFTQGDTAATIQFEGPPNDPVPTDVVVDFGQKQDTAIKSWQAG
jgi:hypothetical protein